MEDKVYTSDELIQATGLVKADLERYLEMLKPLGLEVEGGYKESAVTALNRLKLLEERGKAGNVRHYIRLEDGDREMIPVNPQKEQAGLVKDGYVAIKSDGSILMVRVLEVKSLPGSVVYSSERIGNIELDTGSTVVTKRHVIGQELDDLELLEKITRELSIDVGSGTDGVTAQDIESLANPQPPKPTGDMTKLMKALDELGDEELDIGLD